MMSYARKANDSIKTPSLIVKELVSHQRGSGRNIAMDRYYTSIELTRELQTNYKLTVLGKNNMIRRHLLEEMKSTIRRDINSTIFAWNGPIMLVSFIQKRRKNVLVLCTEHDKPEVSDRHDKKPMAILDYNTTKAGVDKVDEMVDINRCKATFRRWPISVFCTILMWRLLTH